MQQKIYQIIQKLKAVKTEQGWSLQDIQNMIDAVDPGAVSMTTLRRVFSDKPDISGFRYSSIQPIVAVMLGVEGDNDNGFNPEKAKEYYLQRNALQDVVKLRTEEIDRLRQQMKEADEHHEKEKADLSLLHDRNIDRILSAHKDNNQCHEKAMSVLEQNNAFLQETVRMLESLLQNEKQSRSKLYNDLREALNRMYDLEQKIAQLQSCNKHND